MTVRRIVTNGGSFDSELGLPRMRDNESVLNLIVKVFLRQKNPGGASQTGTLRDGGENFAIVRWSDSEWEEFRSRFARMVNWVWDGHLFLTPPASLPAAVRQDFVTTGPGASTQTPYVTCDLDVQVTDQAQGSHADLRCYRLADEETKTFRSYIEPSSGRDGGIMVNRDVYYEIYFDPDGMRFFNTIAHEIGHVIGLDHPGGANNSAAAYGRPGSPEYREVMGFGTNVTVRQAPPWNRRLKLHTNHWVNWTPTTTRPNQPTLEDYMRGQVP